MLVVCNGFDLTQNVEPSTIQFSQALNDPLSVFDLDIDDPASSIALDYGMEVVIHDENTPPIPTSVGSSLPPIPTPPSHNFCLGLPNVAYVKSGALAANITIASPVSMTFSNNTNGAQGLVTFNMATTGPLGNLRGYVFPGQQYMFSLYITGISPVNIQSIMQLVFEDATGTVIGSTTQDIRTPPTTMTRVSISATAPANAVYAKVIFGGQTTSGTNSGTITLGVPQLEPMWFSNPFYGISYPTPDINAAQVSCYRMPDGTQSRYTRIYAGFIDDLYATYDGPGRTWKVSVAPAASIIEYDSNINATYTNQFDDQIISNIVTTFFSGLLTIGALNTSTPSTVVRGALIPSVTYQDNTFREVLNNLSEHSGYTYYVNPYFAVEYHPAYYIVAPFQFVVGTSPDTSTVIAPRNYQWQKDGTQRRKQVKVIGAKYVAPAITDLRNGTGSQTVFSLSFSPLDVKSVQIAGVTQNTGQSGVHTFVGGFSALIDKANATVTFNSPPPSGTNNVAINYTYELPVSVSVQDQDVSNTPNAPAYAIPNYVMRVNDNTITTTSTATVRGLAELTKFAPPRIIITCKAGLYAQPGWTIFFTSATDNISNQSFIVQKVDGAYLGAAQNEFSYTLGGYNPRIFEHLRNSHKAINRGTSVANITAPQVTDIVFRETASWSDTTPTFSAGPTGPFTYNSARYGLSTYT